MPYPKLDVTPAEESAIVRLRRLYSNVEIFEQQVDQLKDSIEFIKCCREAMNLPELQPAIDNLTNDSIRDNSTLEKFHSAMRVVEAKLGQRDEGRDSQLSFAL